MPDEKLLEEIIEYAEKGFTVAVICNLVSDAQYTWRKLNQLSNEVNVDLFHGRYTFKDRNQIENDVIARYGKGRKAAYGSILVATQVIEQSLDLDFDFMVTQICPIELLFQRLGRLYRHEHANRPSAIPKCVVLSPQGDDFGLHGYIYGNPAYLWRSRHLIKSVPEVVFPRAYREWIELAHSKLENEPELITKTDEDFAIEELGKEYIARSLSVMDARAISDSRAELLTRDGEMGINLLPVDSNSYLLDENSTPLSKLHSERKDLGDNETVLLQTIPCPSGWGRKLIPSRKINDYIVLTVTSNGDSWSYESDQSGLNLTYSKEEGLRKE